MALYECVYIARQDVSSNQVESLTEALTAILSENGGTVAKNEYWGLRNLSYRMKKNRKGHYVLLNIDAPHAAISEFERNMRLNEDVLRYLTIRVDELEEGPSAMMQNKGDRDGRGDRGRRERRDRFAGERGPRRDGPPGDGPPRDGPPRDGPPRDEADGPTAPLSADGDGEAK